MNICVTEWHDVYPLEQECWTKLIICLFYYHFRFLSRKCSVVVLIIFDFFCFVCFVNFFCTFRSVWFCSAQFLFCCLICSVFFQSELCCYCTNNFLFVLFCHFFHFLKEMFCYLSDYFWFSSVLPVLFYSKFVRFCFVLFGFFFLFSHFFFTFS